MLKQKRRAKGRMEVMTSVLHCDCERETVCIPSDRIGANSKVLRVGESCEFVYLWRVGGLRFAVNGLSRKNLLVAVVFVY